MLVNCFTEDRRVCHGFPSQKKVRYSWRDGILVLAAWKWDHNIATFPRQTGAMTLCTSHHSPSLITNSPVSEQFWKNGRESELWIYPLGCILTELLVMSCQMFRTPKIGWVVCTEVKLRSWKQYFVSQSYLLLHTKTFLIQIRIFIFKTSLYCMYKHSIYKKNHTVTDKKQACLGHR